MAEGMYSFVGIGFIHVRRKKKSEIHFSLTTFVLTIYTILLQAHISWKIAWVIKLANKNKD